jgi:hypothetical protein
MNLRRGIAGERASDFGGAPRRGGDLKDKARATAPIKQTNKVARSKQTILTTASARPGVLAANKQTEECA